MRKREMEEEMKNGKIKFISDRKNYGFHKSSDVKTNAKIIILEWWSESNKYITTYWFVFE